MTDIKRGYLSAIIAVFFWSLNVLIAQGVVGRLSPTELSFGRWFFAVLILLPLGWKGLQKNGTFLFKHWYWVLGLALSGIVLDNTLIYIAAKTVTAVNLSLLNLLGPVFLVILTFLFLKQRISKIQLAGISITIFGVLTVLSKGNFQNITNMRLVIGDFWMILNAFCFALYSFLQLRRPDFISQTTLLTATALTGGFILLPFFIIFNSSHLFHLTLGDYLIFAYLGIFNSVISYLAWNTALHLIGPIKTGIIYYLQPFFSTIGALIFFATPISLSQIIGGLTIIIGVYIVNRFQNNQKKP